jgi:glycosyltransferase involved in cell wall biosynthesis
MNSSYPRVAFFTDCFHEINGVARTSRELEAFARRRGLPFLSVHCGDKEQFVRNGPLRTLQMRRGRAAVPLECDLGFDPFLWRYGRRVAREVRNFDPDLIHVTSPGDVGQMGTFMAFRLGIPLVASWHTNLHEYAESRLERMTSSVPRRLRKCFIPLSKHLSMTVLQRFYRLARLLFAPTVEMTDWLRKKLERPTRLMRRGVDTMLFAPSKRTVSDESFRLGFVGRLSPEKNLRFLVELERYLLSAGRDRFKFVIVGEGKERPWLEKSLKHVDFTGVLRGEDLARAYADMDLFVFPSHTDTFGNVVLEAQASGVPAVVTSMGGPKHVVQPGITGLVAADEKQFMEAVLAVMSMSELRKAMSYAARKHACRASWGEVFEDLYEDYMTYCPVRQELPAAS